MRSTVLFVARCALTVFALSSVNQSRAAEISVLIDLDNNSATGCTIPTSAGNFVGAEHVVVTTVQPGGPTTQQITGITKQNCSGSILSAPINQTLGAWPAGLNNGVGGASVVESEFIATADLPESKIRLGVISSNGPTGNDALLTTNGLAGAGPILFGLATLNVPMLGGLGLLLMAVLFAVFAWRAMRRNRFIQASILLGLVMISGLALAAVVRDGLINDWAGIGPVANDPTGDGSPDIRAFFVAQENARKLSFRIDALLNQAPVVNAQTLGYLEDSAAQTIVFTATDGDADPLTFSIGTSPTKGVLSAITPINTSSASVTYTPSLNQNGADSFTVIANDGIGNSAPATMSISLTPVNDAPSFVVGPTVTVIKDSGAQTISPWATTISAGPVDEVAQVLNFTVVSNDNPAMFAVAPSVSANGNLSFTTAQNQNGTANLTLRVTDNGGVANGGVDQSLTQNFSITFTAVNDEPSFIAGANQAINEDAGAQSVNAWASAISAGPPDEAAQTLTFNITSNSNPGLFSTPPSVSSAGVLTYTPAVNANGTANIALELQDNGGTANGGDDTSATQNFSITVAPINDAPSFLPGANITVLKDSGAQTINPWATAISAGPIDEVAQTLNFVNLTNSNPEFFSVAPAISASGVLTFTTAPNANGTANLSVQLQDNGGTANGGVDISAAQNFTITLTAVNDAPSFTAGANQNVNEDAAAQSIVGWATAISAGPPDEAGQSLTFNVTNNTNPGLFSAGPAVSPAGVLSYTLAADANGAASITINLQDDGGTANGGADTSPAQIFSITVAPVNDAPSFVVGPDQTVGEDAGAQIVNPWATGLSAGPPNESTQTLSFNITNNTNPTLFSVAPSVSANGLLSYTPAANVTGSATISITVQDNGGTLLGGVDTSAAQTFLITVNDVNDAPSFIVGANQIQNEDSGAQVINSWASAISPGPANEAGQTISFNITGNTNPGLFSVAPAVSATGVLTYTPAANAFGVASISLTAQDNGGTANGGVDTSPAQSFTITLNSVNDVPSFIAGANVSVAAGAGAQTIDPWATAISAGPANESAQTLTFIITANDNPALFLVAPAVSATGVLTFTGASGGVANLNLRVQDNGGLLNGGVDTSAVQNFSINIDSAPAVSSAEVEVGNVFSILPLGLGVSSDANTQIRLTFSEAVNPTGVWAQVLCSISGSATVGSGLAVTALDPVFVLARSVNFSPGDACTLTVFAAQVVDDDAIDPPNNMAANFVVSFNVDQTPTVSITAPANGATNVAANANVVVNLSEAVTINSAAAFSLECPTGAPQGFTVTSPAVLPASATSFTLDPASDLPSGTTCTATVFATSVTDTDIADPPDQLAANFVWSFTTDAAPAVTGGTPLNGATNVSTTTPVIFTFSEAVDAAAGAITVSCSGAIAGAISGTGSNTLTFTPSAALPEGALCTATAVAANINDSDLNDPPGNLAADVSRTFTTDAAPNVTGTTPLEGATNVLPSANLVVNFSEPVNFALGDFTIVCNAVSQSFTLSGSGTNTATLTPTGVGGLLAGSGCVFTVLGATINDVDAGDPPNFVVGNTTRNFTTAAVANDDALPVTPHLTISSVGGAAELDANDNLGAAVITSFGFGVCTGTTAGSQLDAGAANGRLTVNANGSFSYEPPAGVANATRTFCYTITGGDTANIAFNIANTELVWFVDGTAAVGGIGTQARPFQTLTSAASADTTNDSIFLADGAYTANTTLEAGEGLIGDGSTGTLATHTGITPVTGSAFPSFSGTAPVITCGGTCITLAIDNTLRGFTIGNSGVSGTDLLGNGFGTLLVNEVTLNGDGQALNLGTGVLIGNFIDIDVTASSTNGIRLNSVGGSWSVTGLVTIAGITTGNGITIISTASPAANFDFAGGVNVTSAAAPPAILVNSASATAVIRFASMSIVNTASVGLQLVNAPLTIDGSGNSIAATGGHAIFMQNTTLNAGAGSTFATVSSTNSSGFGIALDNVVGSLTMNGGSISGAAGNSFDVNGGASNITYAGSITNTAAARLIDITARTGGTIDLTGALSGTSSSTGINIASNTGGTINLSNASKVLNTGINPAVTLATNTGATINFTGGGLAINTTSGGGINATGGGTISVTGSPNSIASSTGTALNVQNSNIGASGMTFRSITSNGSGTANGINLVSTGNTGSLTVTGTGTAASGGTISNKTGTDLDFNAGIGIRLENTLNPSFTRMQLNDFQNFAVRGLDVNGLTFTNSVINGANGTNTAPTNNVGEGGMAFGLPGTVTQTAINGLIGTVSLNNTQISGVIANPLHVQNHTGTLTMTGNAMSISGSTGGSGAWFNTGAPGAGTLPGGDAVMLVTFDGATFSNHFSAGVLVTANATTGATANKFTITNSTFNTNNTGIDVGVDFSADLNLVATGNTLLNTTSNAFNIVGGTNSTTSSTYQAEISNNNIGNGTVNSGSMNTFGIAVDLRGDMRSIMRINANNVRNTDIEGIFMQSRLNVTAGQGIHNWTVTNNTVGVPDDNSAFPFFAVYTTRFEARNNTQLTMNIQGNTFANGVGGLEGMLVRERDSALFRLERLSDGDATPNELLTNTATVVAQLATDNPATLTRDAALIGTFLGFTEAANGATLLPTIP